MLADRLMEPDAPPVTGLLADWRKGDAEALNRLVGALYGELKRIAARHVCRGHGAQTLSPTALLHEAYLRLARQAEVAIENRAHFFNVASQVMRCVVVDRARARCAAKRNGNREQVTLDESLIASPMKDRELVALDDALTNLARVDPQRCRLVELRFFGGLEVAEAAEALGISPRTAAREWAAAKAWLYLETRRQTGPAK